MEMTGQVYFGHRCHGNQWYYAQSRQDIIKELGRCTTTLPLCHNGDQVALKFANSLYFLSSVLLY